MTPHAPLSMPMEFVRLLFRYPLRWIVPTVLIAAVALVYAVGRKDVWEASQALIVRNEAAGNVEPGKFRHTDEMKTVLETVLELGRSRGVLEQALIEAGPPQDHAGGLWPIAEDAAWLSDSLKITPPKGAEFGKTEVFYLKVRSHSREWSIALATAVANQLEARYNALRDARAKSMVRELGRTVEMADADVADITGRIKKLEEQVGGDLAELRNLHNAQSGESDLRRKSLELENELRKAESQERTSAELLKSLLASQADEGRILSTPNGLLESQPALRRLKDGLLDAQMRTAQLRGNMSSIHPQVLAATAAEREIAAHLKQELDVAIRGAQVDWQLANDHVQSLTKQRAALGGRLEKLAGLRAEYSNLLAESDRRNRLLEEAQRELVDARGSQASSQTSSLINRIDTPDTGTRPVGPSRTTICLAGFFGGLAIGLGLLLLSIQPAPPAPTVLVASATAGQPLELSASGLSFKKALSKVSGG